MRIIVALLVLGVVCAACRPPRGDPDEAFIACGCLTMGHEPVAVYPSCEG